MPNPERRLTPEERQEINRLVEMLNDNKMCWELSASAIVARCEALNVSFEAVLSDLFLRGWRRDLFGRILIKTAATPLMGDDGKSAPPTFMDLDVLLRDMADVLGYPQESP